MSHQRRVSGIHCTQEFIASEGSSLALKPRGDVTRSPKWGYQWHDVLQNFFLKNIESIMPICILQFQLLCSKFANSQFHRIKYFFAWKFCILFFDLYIDMA